VAVWWCEATYKVGRQRALPSATAAAVEISAARNEYEPFQIVLRPDAALSKVTVSVSDFIQQGGASAVISATNVEVCLVEYVTVTNTSDIYPPVYGVAGSWPDPIVPLTNAVTVAAATNQPFWFTVYVPKDAPSGDYEAVVTFTASGISPFEVPVQLHVFNFALSDATHTRTAYYVWVHTTWHKPANLEQSRYIFDLYMENFRKHRVTPEVPHLYAPIVWQLTNGNFTVDFTDFDAAMSRYLDELDFNGFTVMGRRNDGVKFPLSLGGYASFTPEYTGLLKKLMDPIMAHLREKGWDDKAYCYWADEPNTNNIYNGTNGFAYALAGMDALRTAAPGLRRMLTLNNLPYPYDALIYGKVDIWVPVMSLHEYTPQLKNRRIPGEEMWWYGAVGPPSPFPTYFLDHPAINHRIRFWVAEKYGIKGDLYYSVNTWNKNPWLVTRQWDWAIQNGDGVLLYPPTKTLPSAPVLTGPINTIRWEMVREALEDAEYLWLIKQSISNASLRLGPQSPEVLEGSAARNNALSLVPTATSYSMQPLDLYAARERMAHAIEALDDGAPFIVKSPRSQAVASGGSITLRAEALGWPLPQYQWKLNGTNLSGATGSSLVLSNCGPDQAGLYTVVVTNTAGKATSTVAQVQGYWSEIPVILTHPSPFVQYERESATLSVTAISETPLSYLWLKDGQPVSGADPTRSVLMLTNLNAVQSGDYSVMVSNTTGCVTSKTAHLIVLWQAQTNMFVSKGSSWRYYDTAEDLGTAWREPEFNDSGWAAGPAPLGFGNGNESTLAGTNALQSPATVYFRQTVELSQAQLALSLTGKLRRDDGAVIYLNGTEVFRTNLPEGTVSYATSALTPVDGASETNWTTLTLPSQNLHAGTNVIAVEVHQYTGTTGLAAFWKFDEAGSPWQDSVGGHHLVSVGTSVTSCLGRVEGGVTNLSGSSWLETPDAPDLRYSGPFTVGGWFAWGGPMANYSAVNCVEKTNEFQLAYTGQATNRFRFRVNNVEVRSLTGSPSVGQWRFVVAWYDGTNASIQVENGSVYTVAAPPPAPTANPLMVLKPTGASGPFMADEVFLYRRVLSTVERTAIYTNGLRSMINPPLDDLAFDLEAGLLVTQAPEFVEQPGNVSRYEGQTAALRAIAVSRTNVTYQWMYNGVAIPGETNIVLFIPGLITGDAGQYALIATSQGGTASSYPATLQVFGRPELRAEGLADGAGIALTVPASESSWSLLYSTNLTNWRVLTNVPPAAQDSVVVDSRVTNNPVGFYRLQLD
jgi:hypothetical protein